MNVYWTEKLLHSFPKYFRQIIEFSFSSCDVRKSVIEMKLRVYSDSEWTLVDSTGFEIFT